MGSSLEPPWPFPLLINENILPLFSIKSYFLILVLVSFFHLHLFLNIHWALSICILFFLTSIPLFLISLQIMNFNKFASKEKGVIFVPCLDKVMRKYGWEKQRSQSSVKTT